MVSQEEMAQTRRGIDGAFRLPEIVEGVEFKDGIKQKNMPPDQSATNIRA